MVRDDAVVDVRIALGACFGPGYSRTYTHAYVHARGRQCFYKRAFVRAGYANSLRLICRGNTRKITKTFCWWIHYWSAKIDRITRNAVKVDRWWLPRPSSFITADPSDQKEISRACAPDDQSTPIFGCIRGEQKKWPLFRYQINSRCGVNRENGSFLRAFCICCIKYWWKQGAAYTRRLHYFFEMVERDWFYCCFYCLTQAACRTGPGAKMRESRQFSSQHKVHLTTELKFQVHELSYLCDIQRFNVSTKMFDLSNSSSLSNLIIDRLLISKKICQEIKYLWVQSEIICR